MNSRKALVLLPMAMGLATQGLNRVSSVPRSVTSVSVTRTRATKDFSIPIENLSEWSKSVVVSLSEVHVEGNSAVHTLENDCEIHFGAHDTAEFNGEPNGLVLEPMNACVDPPPTGFNSWPEFAKTLESTPIAAKGVPRIWPEHLEGGADSNPDHAVELHPLVSVAVEGKTYDFSGNVDAGDYHGKDGNRGIVGRVSVQVTSASGIAQISFQGGQIGNFTTLDLLIDRASITPDGTGSFRMLGRAALDDATFPVRIVTVEGSPINASMPGIKKKSGSTEEIDGALVLYSLSPQALVDAASKSHGQPVEVETPIQLILYGTPESD